MVLLKLYVLYNTVKKTFRLSDFFGEFITRSVHTGSIVGDRCHNETYSVTDRYLLIIRWMSNIPCAFNSPTLSTYWWNVTKITRRLYWHTGWTEESGRIFYTSLQKPNGSKIIHGNRVTKITNLACRRRWSNIQSNVSSQKCYSFYLAKWTRSRVE